MNDDHKHILFDTRTAFPDHVAKEICNVQPVSLPKGWNEDPLVNSMLDRFAKRLLNK